MKFLFVGLGSIGRRHVGNIKALLPKSEIHAYRVRNQDISDFERQHQITVHSSLDAALHIKPDAVFITNPTSMHLNTAMNIAREGIPMFIEKPLSDSLTDIDKFTDLCRQKNVPVMLGYKMRFHPSIIKLKQLIDSGNLGRLASARAYYGGYLPDWHPWEDHKQMYSARKDLGGGIILDAIHEIDYLGWLCGHVLKVSGMHVNTSMIGIEVEDIAEINLKFQNGCLGNIHVNYLQKPEFRRCEILGSLGSAKWESDSKKVLFYSYQTGEWTEFLEPENFDPNRIFIDEMKAFLQILDSGKYDESMLENAVETLKIALEAKSI